VIGILCLVTSLGSGLLLGGESRQDLTVKCVFKAQSRGVNCSSNLPSLAPFLVQDEVSMFTAITLLMGKRDPGVNAATIEFTTGRTFWSFSFNAWKVLVRGAQLGAVAVREKIKLSVTSSPMSKNWF
jgi:hypothetical protein